MQDQPTPAQRALVFWVLWAAFLVGVVIQYRLISRPYQPDAVHPAAPFPWIVGVLPVLVSTLIRWVILPKISNGQQALVCLVIGIAFAESVNFLGMFLFPERQQDFFILAVLGVAQFIPIYARRLEYPAA